MVQRRRDQRAALRLMCKLFRDYREFRAEVARQSCAVAEPRCPIHRRMHFRDGRADASSSWVATFSALATVALIAANAFCSVSSATFEHGGY
jgi:hypothetical protein